MYLITYVAYPSPTSPEWEESDGAYINAWLDETSFEEADRVARTAIRENGWMIESIERWEKVDAATYANKREGRKYFEQKVVETRLVARGNFGGWGRPLNLMPLGGWAVVTRSCILAPK